MLKKLQERVNRGTKEADATAKKDPDAKAKPATVKLAEKQLEIEEMARKVGQKAAPPGGN